jgi:hypothetical protein
MKNKIRKITISGDQSKYFQGEMMVCNRCGKQQRSNPKKSSDWTVIEVGGNVTYVCPKCFGVPGWSK